MSISMADALLGSVALVRACRGRWRIRALATVDLALGELALERGAVGEELGALAGDRAAGRAIAGELSPDLDLEARLDAVDAVIAGPAPERAVALLRAGSEAVRRQFLAEQPLVARRLRPEMVLTWPGTRRAPQFVGSLARPGDADRYPGSTPLAEACARRCFDEPRPDLVRRVAEIAAADRRALAALAMAHYGYRGVDPVDITRGIRRGAARDRALVRLAIAALSQGRAGDLHRFTAALEGDRARDVGALLRGVGRLRRGDVRAGRRELGRVRHLSLAGPRDRYLRAATAASRDGLACPPIAVDSDPIAGAELVALLSAVRLACREGGVAKIPAPRALTSPPLAAAVVDEMRRAGLGEIELLAAGLPGEVTSAWAAALLAMRVRGAWRGDVAIDHRRTVGAIDALEKQVRSRITFHVAGPRIDRSLAALASRLRGDPAPRALVELIDRRELPAPIAAPLRALLAIDRRGTLEQLRTSAKPNSFASRWCLVWSEADRRGRTDALVSAIAAYRERCGRLPPGSWIEPLGRAVESSEPASWSAEVDAAFAERTPDEVAARLLDDAGLLLRALWTRGPVFGRSAPTWDLARYRDTLAAAIDPRLGIVCPGTVARLARLAAGRSRARALDALLRRGAAPVPALLDTGRRTRLRFLDKRDHILEHIRFADAYGCCFTSNSEHYAGTTRDQILALWRDPMSLAFLAEERRAERWEARGFVFGSYGIVRGAPVVLLNGIYLRGQERGRRKRIVAALERAFAGLGVHRLAIANDLGGRGWLPGRYARTSVVLERLRALEEDRASIVHDDIGGPVNRLVRFDHLLWSPRLRSSATIGK